MEAVHLAQILLSVPTVKDDRSIDAVAHGRQEDGPVLGAVRFASPGLLPRFTLVKHGINHQLSADCFRRLCLLHWTRQ